MINQKYISEDEDEQKMREYARTILREGYLLLPNFLEAAFLNELEQFAERMRAQKEVSSKSDDGTPMMRLARSPEFMRLFDTIHRFRLEFEEKPYVPLSPERQRVGLPYKDATEGKETKQTEFHYDGAYINATIGIIEPPVGQGELHLFPNFRTKFSSSLMSKVVSRFLRHSKRLRSFYGYTHVPSKRNVLCLFFGDRSLHGVEPIMEGERLIVTINNHW